MSKRMIPCLYLKNEKAVTGFGQRNLFGNGDVKELACFYRDNGGDELLIFDFSSSDEEHEGAIRKIQDICSNVSMPVMAAGNIKELDDVKKLIYAGCSQVVLNFSKESNIHLLKEVSQRFGKEKIAVSISDLEEFTDNQRLIQQYADTILALDALQDEIAELSSVPVIVHTDLSREEMIIEIMKGENVLGLSGSYISHLETNLEKLKEKCRKEGISVRQSLVKHSRRTLEQKEDHEEWKKEEMDSISVLKDISHWLQKQKADPKKEQYSDQLFQQGICGILKRLGEECIDILISAEAMEKEKLTSGISEILYDIMVLMAEKEISWEDIALKLSKKRK